MLSNQGKFRDRDPDTVPAGKLFNLGSDASKCMKIPRKPRTPEQVHKFRCTTQSAPGRTRVFYGRYSDPDIASLISHGVSTQPSLVAGELVNPQPQSYFRYRVNQKREESVYASQKRAPLGKSHDQRLGLPAGVDPSSEVYGLPTIKDCSAGELVSPQKTRQQVKDESLQGLELYKKSHSAYTVGESYDRRYDWSRIPSTSSFGIETPHDNRGLNTKRTLKWLHETMSKKAAQISSKRVDAFRERNIPQVGIVHDPIKETMKVNDDHTFGVMVRADDYGAGDLIHMRNQSGFLRGRERERGVLAAVRQHLKKANYHNFTDLKAAFSFYDKNKDGKIDMSELREVCALFHLPVQTELLQLLMDRCDTNLDGQIDYVEFANFLNWKDKMPNGFQTKKELNNNNTDSADPKSADYEKKILNEIGDTYETTKEVGDVEVLSKQIDRSGSDYKTSSSVLCGNVDNYTTELRPYGIPTIRSDRPAPRIRRIGDNTEKGTSQDVDVTNQNYGDESDAYGLMNPSIYSNYGVFEEDFFKSRDQNEIRRIFDSIGVQMTDETFQEIWKQARETSPDGQVSVETFRNVLDECMAEEFVKVNNNADSNNSLRETVTELAANVPDLYKKFHTEKKTAGKEEKVTSQDVDIKNQLLLTC